MVPDVSSAASLRALLEIGRAARLGVDLDALLDAVAETTCEALGFRTAVVNVYRPADDELVAAAAHGDVEARRTLVGATSPRDRWQPLLAARFELAPDVFFIPAGEVAWEDSVPIHVPERPGGGDAGAWQPEDALVAALHDSGRRLLGVISVDEPLSARRPGVAVAETLSAVAAHLGHAIELRHTADTDRRRTRALNRLADMAAAALDAQTLDHANAAVCEAVRDALGFADVEIAVSDDGESLRSRAGTAERRLDRVAVADALALLEGRPDGCVTLALPGTGRRESARHGRGPLGWRGEHVLLGLGDQDGRISGVLRASAPHDRLLPGEPVLALLRAFAQQAGSVTRSHHLRAQRDREHTSARRDAVTGLPNRLAVDEALHRADAEWAAVLCVGLDDVPHINSSLGHDAGDALLRAVATRLRQLSPEDALVARVGGEHFAILLRDRSRVADAARRIHAVLVEPVTVAGVPVHLSPAVGFVPNDAADVLRCAHHALDQARAEGRPVAAYDPATDRSRRRLELTSALHRAVERDELQVVYQPLYDLDDDELLGAEALLRWRHCGEAISPAEFIPLAEQSGAIEHIGTWVLDRVCAQIGAWTRAGLACPVVGVNVAPRQFVRTDLVGTVIAALDRHGAPAERLCVELTETALATDPQRTAGVINALHRHGVRCAIDDFGADHSSLSRLSMLPVQMVKLDRQFLVDVPADPRPTRLLEAILSVASKLGLRTVVEGIETPEQAALCAAAGAVIGQGFLLGRPTSAAELAALLTTVADAEPVAA